MADLDSLALSLPQATKKTSADGRPVYFTTPHFDGYAAVLVRIPDLPRLERQELRDLVEDAWLTRAQKGVANAWLETQGP
jgi:hypothetical protein